MEALQVNAIKVRDELLISNGIIVDTDVILLQSLETLAETAELYGVELNPEVRKYLETLKNAGVVLPAIKADLTAVTSEQKQALFFALQFASAIGQAAILGEDLFDTIRNIAKQLAARAFTAFILSLLPGSGGFVKQFFGFEHGTNFAPGGLALVGERGPEIVNLPRGSQVIPNNQINNSFSTRNSFTLVFPAVREIDDFELQTNIIPRINRLVQRGESRLTASDLS